MRLHTSVHLKTPAIQRRDSHLSVEQGCSRLAIRGDEFTGKRSHRNSSTSSERVRLLQPLLPRPQKGWRPPAHPRSQTPELCPHETAVQNDYSETDPLANTTRGLVIFSGSERRLLSHPGSPPSQTILKIRLRGSGISIHGPALRTVPGSSCFYKVHVSGSLHSETDGNPHSELPQWRDSHFTVEQGCSRLAIRGDEFTGKRSHRNSSTSSERVRLLQPLLPRPQKGWRPPAHP